MKKLIALLTLVAAGFANASAQTSYAATDEYVKQLGSMDSLNLAQIAKKVVAVSGNNQQQARAIFYWIANNIAIDPKATKANDQRKSLPEDVVKLRKATPLGFAKLYQEMASIANIRCLVVDGYIRNSIDDLNNPADEVNHSWNVVQLGQSPDSWYVVDAAKASGSLDKKMAVFNKKITGEYFFADKTLFHIDHLADNDAWQLGGVKSKKEFYSLPVIYSPAYEYGLKKPTPATGYIKTKTKGKVSWTLPMDKAGDVKEVSLLIGEGRKLQKPEPMNFSASGNSISFSYQFKKDDTHPVKILVDGKEMLEYMVEVTE
ncbi:MAG: transglutaminase domain-containing protein [Ferruginibacter sp.]